MRSLLADQRDWLRKELGVGPYVKVDLMLSLMGLRVGKSLPEADREEVLRELKDAKAEAVRQSADGGSARSLKNKMRKLSIIHSHADLFERVRKGGSADRAATHLLARLIDSEAGVWIPSRRTLNAWFAECRHA